MTWAPWLDSKYRLYQEMNGCTPLPCFEANFSKCGMFVLCGIWTVHFHWFYSIFLRLSPKPSNITFGAINNVSLIRFYSCTLIPNGTHHTTIPYPDQRFAITSRCQHCIVSTFVMFQPSSLVEKQWYHLCGNVVEHLKQSHLQTCSKETMLAPQTLSARRSATTSCSTFASAILCKLVINVPTT